MRADNRSLFRALDVTDHARLRVLMIVSEAVPFSKTGGLADVSSALSVSIAKLGHAVTVILPRYRESDGVGKAAGRCVVRVGGLAYDVGLFEASLGDGVRAVLLDCPSLYDRDGLYGDSQGEYSDNPIRFSVLVRAALDLAAGAELAPSVIHAHDWQAGLTPVYLSARVPKYRCLQATASVLTIHNLAYQGTFSEKCLDTIGLSGDPSLRGAMKHGAGVSFLKGGIVLSDAVTTVSPRYAEEIVGVELGRGLDASLRSRGTRLTGILNGVDDAVWNPESDPFLPMPFSTVNLGGKLAAKRAMLQRYGLPTDDVALARPVVGMVSRLVPQKGLDLIVEVADELLALDLAFVVLGTGRAEYQDLWRELSARHPDRVGAYIGFDEERAHLIEGGADLFLMPSRYEPCGLNQMYSLRYGTVPIVRATGGLADSVEPYNGTTGKGNGFAFRDYSGAALLASLQEALTLFKDRDAWRRLQIAGMSQDNSWNVSAREYVKVYRKACNDAEKRVSGSWEQQGIGPAAADIRPV